MKCEICEVRDAMLLKVFIIYKCWHEFPSQEVLAMMYLCNTCYKNLKSILERHKCVEVFREGI